MNKKISIIIVTVLVVFFSVISFVVPFNVNGNFWISYIFGMIAILSQIYFLTSAFGKDDKTVSKIYGFPIARIGIFYLIVQFIASVVEMKFSRMMPIWSVLVINVLLLCFAVLGSIATEGVRDEIIKQDATLEDKTENIKKLRSISESIVGMCSNDELKRTLSDISEKIRYSDPVSSDSTKGTEELLFSLFDELKKAILDNKLDRSSEICSDIVFNLKKRNRLCKMGKNY